MLNVGNAVLSLTEGSGDQTCSLVIMKPSPLLFELGYTYLIFQEHNSLTDANSMSLSHHQSYYIPHQKTILIPIYHVRNFPTTILHSLPRTCSTSVHDISMYFLKYLSTTVSECIHIVRVLVICRFFSYGSRRSRSSILILSCQA
jgi:hypothetical protein